MKKLLLTLAITFVCAFSLNAEVITKNYYFNDYQVLKKGDYQLLYLKNTQLFAKVGEPLIPYHSISLLLPQGEEAVSIEVTGKDKTEIKGNFVLYPKQYSQPVSSNNQAQFIKNKAAYLTNQYSPESLAGNLSTEYMNGCSFAISTFTPMQYNPVTQKVYFYKRITVKIHTKKIKGNAKKLSVNKLSKEKIDRIKKLAQNPKLISGYKFCKVTSSDDYSLLIITPFEFKNNFLTLKNLYLNQGIKTKIVSTEDINSDYQGIDLQEKIRNFIIHEYQNYNISYVLLGGDNELIPARGFYCQVQSSQVYEDDNIPSDLYYSALDGSWNDDGDNLWGEIGEDDLLPDVSVARLTFSNTTDLTNMINKIVSYQENPVPGELNKPFLVGEKAWDDPLSWGAQYVELLVGHHQDNGYTTDGIPETNDIDTLYDRGSESSWTSTMLLEKINEGKSFIHHLGHSNNYYNMRLYTSDITDANFSQLDGVVHNYTIVYSEGCISAAFDYDDCIAEKMLNIQNFAVAYIGNSRYGWFNEGSTEGPSIHLQREFVNALYSEKISRIGAAHLESRMKSASWVNAPGQHEEGALRWVFYDCNVLGDPAMPIWTDNPVNVNVSYNDTIKITDTILNVSVTFNGNPVEDIRCVLIQDSVLHGVSLTDSTGMAQININPYFTNTDSAKLIVSGYNCITESYGIKIIIKNNAYVVLNSYEITDDNNNQPEFDENIELNTCFKNIGDLNAENVNTLLTCNDEYISIIDSVLFIDVLNANDSSMFENAYSFHICANVPDKHIANFKLKISQEDSSVRYFDADVEIFAPVFSIEKMLINDVSGNNNGVLDIGEDAQIIVPVKDIGHAASSSVHVLLTTDNEYITIYDSVFDISSISVDSTVNAVFNININNDIALGDSVKLICKFTSGDYYEQKEFITIIGLGIEEFETGDFSRYNWHLSGNANWNISTQAFEGNYSAKSGDIENSQSSTLYVKFNVLVNGEISFYKKVSSEENYDYLSFYIDTVKQGTWCGDIDWSYESFHVDTGVHTFKWEYKKDHVGSQGDDCAFIDNVFFPPVKATISVTPFEINNSMFVDALDTLSFNVYNLTNELIDYDINIEDADSSNWLSLNNNHGNIEADDSVAIMMYFNTHDVSVGKYSCLVNIFSVDTITLPINLTVSVLNIDNNIIANRLTNFPNPFSNNTNIKFTLLNKSNTKLIIYDINGKLIKTLINKNLSQGQYSISWNGKDVYGSNVVNGIYFYQLITNQGSATKQMILIK